MSKFDDFKKGLKKALSQDPDALKNFPGAAAVSGAFAGAAAGLAASRGKPVGAIFGAVVGGYAGYKGASKLLEDGTSQAEKPASPDPFAAIKNKRRSKQDETSEVKPEETAAPEATATETAAPAAEEAAPKKPTAPRRKRGGPKND